MLVLINFRYYATSQGCCSSICNYLSKSLVSDLTIDARMITLFSWFTSLHLQLQQVFWSPLRGGGGGWS